MVRRWLGFLLVLAALSGCTRGGSAALSSPDSGLPGPVTEAPSPSTTAPPTTPASTLRTIESLSECSPIPASVGLPETGSTEHVGPVTLFFEEPVTPLNRERVLAGLTAGQEYIAGPLGGFRFREPICVDVRAGSAGSSIVGVVYGANHIVLYTGARPLQGAPGWLLAHVTAHELIHFWQKGMGNPRDGAGPVWLLEGAAELLGYQAVVQAGLVSGAETRTYSLRRVTSDPPGLESMAHRTNDPGDFSYPLAYLATELLTAERGPGSLREYWRGLSRGKEWEVAFVDAFGVVPAEFYLRFEEYRRRGFR